MRHRQGFLAVALATLIAQAAGAQPTAQLDYPSKPIRFIIPFAVGGPVDALGRGIGQKFTSSMGLRVPIDNRSDANTILAL